MSKYIKRSTKQVLSLLQNRGYYARNGDLYDIPNDRKRVLTNFDRSSLISFLEQYDAIYAQTIKTNRRFSLYGVNPTRGPYFNLGYNFTRIKHKEV